MDRRLLITAWACWPATCLRAQGDDGQRPRHKVSAAQLYEALSARFPVRLGIPGLLDLKVSAPGLVLLPRRNRLGASLIAQASGPGPERLQEGALTLVFALRYEGRDQSIRAHEPEVIDVRIPGLPAESLQALQIMLPQAAREIAAELVLHRFTARELALPDAMGFEPDTLTVVDDGVVVAFRPKARRPADRP